MTGFRLGTIIGTRVTSFFFYAFRAIKNLFKTQSDIQLSATFLFVRKRERNFLHFFTLSHLPVVIGISRRKRPRGGRDLRRRKQFAEFQEQVTQSIIPKNPDQIREIKNFDEFSSLFESLLERAESTIQRKTIKKVDSLQAPATSLKFKHIRITRMCLGIGIRNWYKLK